MKFVALQLSLPLALGLAAALSSAAASAQDAHTAPAAQASKRAGPSSTFRVPRGTPEGVPDFFEFEAGGFTYHIAATGNGRRTKGDKTRRFNLRVDGRIERVYFADYKDDVLLVGELDYGESGAGFVRRLEQPSMRALWGQSLPSFNVGEPLRDGRRLYVTCIGFVAALDLDTGEYVWKHDGLYGRRGAESFNAFDVPEVSGGEVSFRDRRSDAGHRVVVNRKTGKVVRME